MRELAVAIQNENEKVSIIETINSIKKAGFKMYLFNGMMKTGNTVKYKCQYINGSSANNVIKALSKFIGIVI